MKGEIKRGLIYSLVALGISSVTLQVLLMRELLAYTGGNELVIGIYLSFWMLYTGLGSFLGRYFRVNVEKLVPLFQFILLAVSVIAYLSIPLLRIQHGDFISVIGVTDLILLTLLVLLLPCLVLGMLFPFISGALYEKGTGKVSSYSYGFEAAGNIVGGILIVVLLLIFMDNRSAWIFLIAVNIPAIIQSSGYLNGRYYRLILIAFSLGLLALWASTDIEARFEKRFLAGKELLASADTPYGRLVATGSGEQVNFFENSSPLFSTGDIVPVEEPVHLGMSFVPDPQNILVVASGNPGFIDELMKYKPGKIDYVTADPWAFRVIGEVIDIPQANVLDLVFTDPLIFLRDPGKSYDVILVLTPPPSTAAANRYYTTGFYDLCRSHLEDEGLLLTSLPGGGNYLNEADLQLHSLIYSTMDQTFSAVEIVSLNNNYFIAGNREITPDLFRHHQLLEGKNDYYNKDYLQPDLTAFRSEQLASQLDPETDVNSTLFPRGYYIQLRSWLSLFGFRMDYFLYPFLFLLLLFLIFLKPVQIGIFTGGFTVSAMQFLLMISFQSLYGDIYLAVALFIAVFMGGLSLGSLVFGKLVKDVRMRHLLLNQLWLLVSVLALPLMAWSVSTSQGASAVLVYSGFGLLTLIPGFLMGVHFGLGSVLTPGTVRGISSGNYAADLAGSALGAFIVSLFVFPLFGIFSSSYLLAGFNLLVIIIMLSRSKIVTLQ